MNDAMIAVIADSTNTTSSDDALSNSSAMGCSRKANSSIDIQPYQVLPYVAAKENSISSLVTATGATNATMSLSDRDSGSETGCGGGFDGVSGTVGPAARKEFSPTVVKHTVTTGNYR